VTDTEDEGFTENERAWSIAAGWGSNSQMNDLETLMWRAERHPQQSSTVAMLMILDQAPDWDRLHAAHDWATRLVPRMRQRVQDRPPALGAPTWVTDQAFELDYHLRRTRLPSSGEMNELLDFAQRAALTPFDRTRPLWEGTLVEGLDGGRAAYFLKLHHSLTDGMGGVQLMTLLQSRVREHTPKPSLPATESPAPQQAPLSSFVEGLARSHDNLPEVASRLASQGARVVRHPRPWAARQLRYLGSARRTLAAPAAGSPLFRERTGSDWRFQVFECPFEELRSAAKAAGGSVNDAFLAALLGGMRRYHEALGVEVSRLPVGMPLSLRKADDPMGGNRFAGAMFAGPMDIADPSERIAAIRGAVLSLRVEPAVASLSLIAPLLNRLPAGIASRAVAGAAVADLSASNVPGVGHPTYMAGAQVERVFGFGPLPGVAVMATLVTHGSTACFGLNCDGSVVHDPSLMVRCMREGLDEVLELGKPFEQTIQED